MSTARTLIAEALETSELVQGGVDEIDMAVAILASALGPDIVAEYLCALAEEMRALPAQA